MKWARETEPLVGAKKVKRNLGRGVSIITSNFDRPVGKY